MHEYKIYFTEIRVTTLDEMQKKLSASSWVWSVLKIYISHARKAYWACSSLELGYDLHLASWAVCLASMWNAYSSRHLTKPLLNSHYSSMLSCSPWAELYVRKTMILIRRVLEGSFAIRLNEMSQGQPTPWGSAHSLHWIISKPSLLLCLSFILWQFFFILLYTNLGNVYWYIHTGRTNIA